MKKIFLKIVVCFCLIFNSFLVRAYEVDTHARLSEEAYKGTVLVQDANLLSDLGIGSTDRFKNSKGDEKSSIDLVQDGARFEDSAFPKLRFLRHFYDPVRKRGLWGFPSSSDWALEDKGNINEQFFSLKDANEFFYGALTRPEKQERSDIFGSLFQAIGHIIHHIQDMAQPQHVRNDAHGEGSLYEIYTNRNDVRESLNAIYGSYRKKILFDKAREYWITNENTPGEGTGIAEFTNHNFVSADTNLNKWGQIYFSSTHKYVQG